jgi:hypothetical protein
VTGAGAYKLSGGAGRQRLVERLDKKMERKGGEVGGRRLLKVLEAMRQSEKREAGGPGVGAAWRAGRARKRGPGRDGGTARAASSGTQPAGVGEGIDARQGSATVSGRRD